MVLQRVPELEIRVIAVVLGILAAAFYGGADFCGGLATRRTTMLSVTVVSQAAGLVLLLGVVPFFPGRIHVADLGWAALAGICGGAGIALLYHALSVGTMGVVSPITAVLAAAVPVAFGAIRGDRLGLGQVLGIGIALVAVVLISSSTQADGTREFSTRGVKEAVASGLILGGFYLFLAHARPSMGLDPLVGARVSSVLFLVLLAAVTKTDLRPRGGTLRIRRNGFPGGRSHAFAARHGDGRGPRDAPPPRQRGLAPVAGRPLRAPAHGSGGD